MFQTKQYSTVFGVPWYYSSLSSQYNLVSYGCFLKDAHNMLSAVNLKKKSGTLVKRPSHNTAFTHSSMKDSLPVGELKRQSSVCLNETILKSGVGAHAT